MISEIQTLYSRLDSLPMTPAERELARARLAQAEAFSAWLHAAYTRLAGLVHGRRPRGQDVWGSEAL